MNQAWYQVMSMLYGYFAAVVIAVVVLMTLRRFLSDGALLRRLKKSTPQYGAVGTLRVLSAGARRLPAGKQIRVPYEGTLGASHSCDVYIPHRRVHLRSAFFWMERDGLHMVALHRDGFFVDDVSVEPGDEAVLRDGAVLRVRELKLELKLYSTAQERIRPLDIGPYVTTQRKSRAQQGRGEGIGAPGKGEIRREKKLRRKQDESRKKEPTQRTVKKAGAAKGKEKKTGKETGARSRAPEKR